MHSNSSTPGKKARIEIIPLIDIMFFLLASFMLVSLSMIRLQAIPTNLPSPSLGAPPPKDKPEYVAIGIDQGGNIYFDKEADPTTLAQIPAKLQPYYAARQDELKVFINVDSAARYDTAIMVLDKIRLAGVSKVSFPVKSNNHFDPAKPRSGTTIVPGGAGAAAAPAASAPSQSPTNP